MMQFPEQSLVVSAGKLFCKACKEEQPNLKESLKRHIGTAKHVSMLAKYMEAVDDKQSLFSDLASYFEQHTDQQGVSNIV